jgi:hypothetical protein
MLKALQHREDAQCQMTDAEVMTTAIVAMLYFRGNFRLASQYLCEHRYIPKMLSAAVSIVACIGYCFWDIEIVQQKHLAEILRCDLPCRLPDLSLMQLLLV